MRIKKNEGHIAHPIYKVGLLSVVCLSAGFLFTVLFAGLLAGLPERSAWAAELPQPVLLYDFEGQNASDKSATDKAGGNDGTLKGRASIQYSNERESNVLYFAGGNSYLEFPQGFFDGRDTMTISMDICSLMDNENFFTVAIGKDSDKYLFLRTRSGEYRYAITKGSWGAEQDVVSSGRYKEIWTNVTLVLTSKEMQLYINGELADVQDGLTTKLSDFGEGVIGYLGKSFYSGDTYFKGYIDNVAVYEEALTAMEISAMNGTVPMPFRNVIIRDDIASVVTWKADKEAKKLTVYVSKSNTGNKETAELVFLMQENVTLKGNGSVSVPYGGSATAEFVVQNDGEEKSEAWEVSALLCGNPVIPGQYADPDIDVFGDKYYLYMTTDGFAGWSGTKFHVFSSDNLVDWVDEGVILDVASKDVAWSVGSAWAPTIEEKNGKYYFYFCAKDTSGASNIGVAVADSPIGPYTAMPEPLMTVEMCKKQNVSMGQAIDPSIFTDEDGTSYLLFGNGAAAIVKLNDDMVSVDLSTLQNYRGVREFREAITVTKRNGTYHFTWSCDDTGSENYHINYGTSDSLFGPIEYQYTVLEKLPEQDILGTGHHCILQIPGKDEYYIAYHRFFTPLGYFSDGTGHHRETCIDVLRFDEATGLMLPVTPTLEGVAARSLLEPEVTPEPEITQKPGGTADNAASSEDGAAENDTQTDVKPQKNGNSIGLLIGICAAVVVLVGAVFVWLKLRKQK